MSDLQYAIEELDFDAICVAIFHKTGKRARIEIMQGEVGNVKMGFSPVMETLFTFSSYDTLKHDLYDFFGIARPTDSIVNLMGASEEQNRFLTAINTKIRVFEAQVGSKPQVIVLSPEQFMKASQIWITLLGEEIDKAMTFEDIPITESDKPGIEIEVF